MLRYLIEKEFISYLKIIRQNKFLSKGFLYNLENYFFSNISICERRDKKTSFIHNDLCSVNIKMKEIKTNCYSIVGILDFESAISGDPIKELCKIEWILNDINIGGRAFYENYTKYISLPDDFRKIIEFYNLVCRMKHLSLIGRYDKFSKNSSVINRAIEDINGIF